MKRSKPFIGWGLALTALLVLPAASAFAQAGPATAPAIAPTTAPTSPPSQAYLDSWHEPSDVATPKLGKDGHIDADFAKKHAEFVQTAQKGDVGLLLLGDSITAGWFWGKDRQVYNAHFGKFHPANFGIGGDRTEHVLWRIDNGELDGLHPKVVILLIGTNNIGYSPDDILKGDLKVIAEIHQKLPDSKLLLNGIFPRGANANDPKVAEMRAKIKTVNQSLAKLDDGSTTRYLDIGPLLVSPDGSLSKKIMPDALHLNYDGYLIWANAMQPLLDDMLK